MLDKMTHGAPDVRDAAFMALVRAIVTGNAVRASRALAAEPGLVTARASGDVLLDQIAHYMYGGDTALHVAAAAYEHDIARRLIGAGADVRARNRRGAEPLHYAADGDPGSDRWDPTAQAATIVLLIAAGADPQASDNSGVLPLHRAVRTRCAAAVQALIEGGANPRTKNRNGSTPLQLAQRPTGRGGSGSQWAKEQHEEIIALLREALRRN